MLCNSTYSPSCQNCNLVSTSDPIEIDDLNKRAANKNYSEEEKVLRRKLASVYRLADLYGWNEGIYNHITCRVPGEKDRFLINPFGFLYNEITASSLVEVDVDGTIVDPGASNFGINNRGFTLHSAIHIARPDAQCVIHLHTPEAIAVSSTKNGMLAISQESCFFGPFSTYEFNGILSDLNERSDITKCLGNNNIMLLRNHGFVICGNSIEQAFLRTFFFIYNIRSEAKLCNVPKDSLVLPSEAVSRKTYETLLKGEFSGMDGDKPMHWAQGELDWEAWMRQLDRLDLKTGHKYRLSMWRK